MSFEKAKAYLEERGLGGRVREFSVSSATVQLAAAALGTDEGHIAKSLSFLINGAPVIIVAAGDVKVDNRKFKDCFHTKAAMLPYDQTEALTGYAPGGVCPFAPKEGVKIYLDESLKRFDTVYPACGNSSSAVELSVAELESATENEGWVSVTVPRAGV